jgi:hypothetical protein
MAALSLELPKALKLLLYDLAIRACPRCGLTWPGIPNLMRSTGMGETLLRETLGELSGPDRKLIVTHRYPSGGRGRATEYIVLPQHTDLSTAPCGECQSRMKTPRTAGGMTTSGQQNPSRGGGYPRNPTVSDAKPHARVTHQQEVQQQQEGASRQVDPQASPSGAATPPLSDRNPATEAREAVEEMLRASDITPNPDRPSHAKADRQNR